MGKEINKHVEVQHVILVKIICSVLLIEKASLVAQLVKSLPAVQETQVQSLCWEDLLEEGMAIHSSILAWRTPWTENFGGLQSTWSHRIRHD